jgi:hypothetical protein
VGSEMCISESNCVYCVISKLEAGTARSAKMKSVLCRRRRSAETNTLPL